MLTYHISRCQNQSTPNDEVFLVGKGTKKDWNYPMCPGKLSNFEDNKAYNNMKTIKGWMAGVGMLMLSSCIGSKQKAVLNSMEMGDTLYLCVGSYAPEEQEGIKVFVFNQETGEATYVNGIKGISNPSYLTVSSEGNRIYAVGEDAGVSSTANALSFDRQTGKISFLNSQPTKGGAPCNIVLSPEEDFVLTANYMGGNISVFPLEENGMLKEGDTINFTGSGPDKERQSQPHLHCVQFTPDGRFLLANDLGTDRIHVFPVKENTASGVLKKEAAFDICLPPGCGPRHLCFAPNGKYAYLITELSGDVIALSYDEAGFDTIQHIKADTLSAQGSADIHLSPDGNYLYASNRLKGDGIAIFEVSSEDGTLDKVGYQSTGIHPRHFNITPNGKFLLVACRDTDEIQIYRRKQETGLLKDTGKRIEMSKPVCVQFLPY